MKYLIAILLSTILLWACVKDTATDLDLSTGKLERRNNDNKVTLCHLNELGEFKVISINPNAVMAHLNHGDYIPDADGDGYTAIGSCTGSMDDCDDTNPEVTNLCTDCLCFDLESVHTSHLLFYYNSDNNPCGIYDEGEGVLLFYLEGTDTVVVAAGVEEDGQHLVGRSHVVNGVVIYPGNDDCIGFVEEGDLTLSQYESCLAGLRTIIAANPGLVNVCDMDNPPVLEDTNPEFQKGSSIK